jgi:hypothetical protein
MIGGGPPRLPITLTGGRPLDPDRPANDEPRPTPAPGPAEEVGSTRSKRQPPGLRRQLGATRDALLALVRAHVDLAKAEASEIGDEIKVVAAASGLAFGALVLVCFLLPIGILLFLGEWLFGSLGWGVLHGTEALVLVALAAVLGVLHAGRVGRSIVIGLIVGTIAAIVLGTNAPNQLYTLIARQFPGSSDPGVPAIAIGAAVGAVIVGLLGAFSGARNGTGGDAVRGLVGGLIIGAVLGAIVGGLVRLAQVEASRPLVVGIVLVGAIVGLIGLVLGARSGGLGGAMTGLVSGILIGGAIGAFTAITFSWHVAIAIGIAVFLGLAIGLMAADVAAHGVDTEELKARFFPKATIDTTKETIEWAKARIPRAPRS